MEKYLLEKEKYLKILDPDEGFNLRVSGNYKIILNKRRISNDSRRRYASTVYKRL
tara:strand:- start:560 stop:724 length:165 start_codon:yes stop_codon:yes gene_type:complete